MSVAIDQPVPTFQAQATSDTQVRLEALKGKQVVLYFYPKDNTPGCTTQGQGFRDQHDAFVAANTVVFGVSRDSLKTHENFKAKQGFPFELICDKDEQLCQLFDVIKLKKLYGKEYLGIDRSTFLIDADGVLRQEWRGVKVPGHVEAVLQAAQALQQR
ncbi:MAG TPA: peroxiredoxin [Pseudomonas sp.]|jgi:thioredoxin-dependent peroxiredoxin|uniref:peroxiredoxin n=1 Tax=Stutzerimonas xanthomarina TaxID=271420 RepID=UPI000E96E600|nr:peroxiredoxin [Stutzerimonas xanthomarina]MBU0810005.1 peroxiredoxin [Gammaproteobacteria bacterium]HAQ84862.1 peroxiredoxin [Pseudomonas sp.]MBK3847141.1 redoxin domain-containing protein [Stutzerimonas xanthomarina]MBU0853876.1 peroxiredoxin [Gammaproteobacteria bacterium]MBU1301441.1 peroxiredoxin [Gammaproteobacteria bacterium]|tara:strand:- start:6280 stop:6753 length:474 start_codon:yes stop_codon:yes gene_type:complete